MSETISVEIVQVLKRFECTGRVGDVYEDGYSLLFAVPGMRRNTITAFLPTEYAPGRITYRSLGELADGRQVAVEIVLTNPL